MQQKKSKHKRENEISSEIIPSKKYKLDGFNTEKNNSVVRSKGSTEKVRREIQTQRNSNSKSFNQEKKIKNSSDKLPKPAKVKIKETQLTKKVTEKNNSFDNEKYLTNLPDFHHVPSDSEEELDESKKNNNKLNNSNDKLEKKLYTDFTENTIFVGNIPLSYNKKKIIKVFSTFGDVLCARIRCVPIANINVKKRVAAIKKEFNPRRNSMAAFVKFKSNDSVTAAIQANGMILDGHHLRIDSAKSTETRDLNKAVFVGGLPFDIEDDELWEFFENCGKILSVRVVRDSHTMMGKGIGYVNFDSTTSVELALQMDGQELKKKVINVKRCLDTNKKTKTKSFGKTKTKEMVSQLLSKKNQTKLKTKNKKLRSKKIDNDFSGMKASVKKKRKKKLSKAALRKKQVVKILNKQ